MKVFFKRITALLLVAVICAGILTSCTVSKAYPGAPEGMRPVSDGSNGVIMYISSQWSVDNSTGIPTAYFSYTDKTMVNMVTVPAEELGERTIPEYFDEYKEKFKATAENDFELLPYSSEMDYTFIRDKSDTFDIYEYKYTLKIATSSSSKTTYKFAQAFFRTSPEADLCIITYSTYADKFDAHYDDIAQMYANLKVVTEAVPIEDENIPKPDFTDMKAPEGYSAITGEHVDYVLFVPSDWTPLVNTGMTAASKASDPSVTCTVTGFRLVNNDYLIDGKDYDSFFEASEKTIKDAFGNITYADESNKFIRVDFSGVSATVKDKDGNEKANEVATRKYVYSINVNGVDYTYEQYNTIKEGDVYILTLCCKSDAYGENAAAFDGIAGNFKFK